MSMNAPSSWLLVYEGLIFVSFFESTQPAISCLWHLLILPFALCHISSCHLFRVTCSRILNFISLCELYFFLHPCCILQVLHYHFVLLFIKYFFDCKVFTQILRTELPYFIMWRWYRLEVVREIPKCTEAPWSENCFAFNKVIAFSICFVSAFCL